MAAQAADELLSRGLAAAASVGRAQGLSVADPRVVSHRGNLLVRLAPTSVLARVATLTGWMRRDPFVWLAREVAVARHGKSRGADVIAPATMVDPGPHWCDGLVVSLWTYSECEPHRADSAQAGEALARLHSVLADFPGDLPNLAPVRDHIDDGLAVLERDRLLVPEHIEALRARQRSVLAEIGQATGKVVVLHGDAHTGNLLPVGDRWLWTDFEETCRGPREWDLATLITSRDIDREAALRGYARTLGGSVSTVDDLAPFLRARELEATIWLVGMAHLYPARYRDRASARISRLLER